MENFYSFSRLLLNSPERDRLTKELKELVKLLENLSNYFWLFAKVDLLATIKQMDDFEILHEKTANIKMHLEAFCDGEECIDDTRLWIELYAADVRKAIALLEKQTTTPSQLSKQ